MIVYTNKQSKRHVIKICTISCVEGNNISEALVLVYPSAISPHQGFYTAFFVNLHAVTKLRISSSHLVEKLHSLRSVIVRLFTIDLAA